MRLLLDTHTLVWWDEGKLPRAAVALIQDADAVFVSAATAWEIAIKASLGKLKFAASIERVVAAYGFEPLAIELKHAQRVRTLAKHHRDPFDRMLIAQAIEESLSLVSRDPMLERYPVSVLWE